MTRLLALLIALLATLAACTRDPAPTAGGRVVRHAGGETTLVGTPRRVVALAPLAVETVVALGVTPVGVTYWGGPAGNAEQPRADHPPYLRDALAGVPTVGYYAQPDLEAVLALAPDLIVCTDEHLRSYAVLSGIAPTLVLAQDEPSSRRDDRAWRRALLLLGGALGREDAARARISEYDAKAESVRGRVRDAVGDGTVLVVRVMAKGFRVSGAGHSTSGPLLYDDLALRPPPDADPSWEAEYVPLERLATLDPDHVLLVEGAESLSRALLAEPLWRNLRAVRSGRVHAVSFAWIRGHGWYGQMTVLDEALRALGDAP